MECSNLAYITLYRVSRPLSPPGGETMEQIYAILVIYLITIVSLGTFCKFSEKNIQALFREGSLYTGCQNGDIYINNA